MGPLSGKTYQLAGGAKRHAKCQSGLSCTGPGCIVSTGKTERKRAKRGDAS